MKPGPALWCALSLLLGSVACLGDESPAATPAPPPPPILVDDQFFVDHPDLTDEADVVTEAANDLATEQPDIRTPTEASEALAAKSRAILAARTPEEWQQKAVSLYPALRVSGSEFNLLFVKHYRELKASSPAFMEEPSWPVLLAKRCDDELRARTAPAAQTSSAPSPATASAARHSHDTDFVRHRSTSFWQTFFSLLLLIILTAIPAAVAFRPEVLTLSPAALGLSNSTFGFRKGRRHSPAPAPSQPAPAPRGDPPIWRTALKHAAIIYLVFAIPASVRSLMVNSDLGFLDRLFVSLLVGALFGLFISLPLYGVDALWHTWHKHSGHSGRPATR